MGYVISILLLFGAVLAAQETTAAWSKKPSQAVFVVTPNHYAQGSTPDGPIARFGDLIMIEIFNPNGGTYRVGQQYRLYSRGENVGSVQVDKVAPLQCDSTAASVSVNGSFRFSKETMALATNAAISTRRSVSRSVTNAERSTLVRLAAAELQKQEVPIKSDAKLEVHDLVATAVDDSGGTTLIGYFSILFQSARHEIFLIAGSPSRIEMSNYHKTTDLDDGKDSSNLTFVDHLDLDGDGIDEVLENTGYESEEFWILTRQSGSWTRVWVGGEAGC